jgi:hypothetical protein
VKTCGVVALAVLALLGGCGGGDDALDSATLSGQRGEASGLASDVGTMYLDPTLIADVSESDVAVKVDKLLGLYDESDQDSEIKGTMRDVAGTLHDSEQDDQAQRLERVTDDS